MLSARTYLPNFVSVAEVVNIVSVCIMLLAADQWMHGAGLSAKCRNCCDVSATIFDLEVFVKQSSRLTRVNAYRLYFESEPVSVFPCARCMVLFDTITASNDGTTSFATKCTTLYSNENDSAKTIEIFLYRCPALTRNCTDTFCNTETCCIREANLWNKYRTKNMDPTLTFGRLTSSKERIRGWPDHLRLAISPEAWAK